VVPSVRNSGAAADAYAPGVTSTPARGEAISRMLDQAEAAPPVDAVEAVTRELGAALGATSASFLILDLSGRAVVRLSHVMERAPGAEAADGGGDRRDVEESARLLPFDGGPVETALRTQALQLLPPGESFSGGVTGGQWGVLAPVTERGEVLGLLEMSLPSEPDEETLSDIARTAHLLGFVVIANGRHTDLFEWGQRSTAFSLPAEIQRRLLPSAFTCEGGAFTLPAWLEPAAHVGGDTFDYSLGRDVLHLSITDAMGHGVVSSLTATLCVGSLRNTRREAASLVEQAAAVGLPIGLFATEEYTTADLVLEPGDRVVFVTDGMLERDAAALDLIAEIAQTRSLHPRETTRRLADNVLEVTGPTLADDATLMVLDWHGHHGRDRAAVAGADPTGTVQAGDG
jgi:hypothetical protein